MLCDASSSHTARRESKACTSPAPVGPIQEKNIIKINMTPKTSARNISSPIASFSSCLQQKAHTTRPRVLCAPGLVGACSARCLARGPPGSAGSIMHGNQWSASDPVRDLWSWFTLTLDLRERIEALAIEDASWIKMYCVLFRKIEKHFPPPIGQAAFDLGSCEKLYERALRNMPKQGQPHPSSLPVNAGVLHTASTPTGALCALRGGGSVTGGLNFSCRSATAGAKGSACHRALRTLGSDERTVDGAPSFCPASGSGHRPLTHGLWSAAGISAAPSGAHGLLPMGDLELSSTAPPFAASAEDAALHARGMANDLWEDVKRQCLANVLHSQQADDQGGAATATAVAMASSGTAAGATIFREAEIDAVATSAGQQVMSHVQLCSVSAPLDTLTLSGNAVVEPLRLLRLVRLAATKDDFLSRPLPASFVKQIALAPSRGCSGAAGSTTDSSNSFIGRGSGGGQQHGETAGGGAVGATTANLSGPGRGRQTMWSHDPATLRDMLDSRIELSLWSSYWRAVCRSSGPGHSVAFSGLREKNVQLVEWASLDEMAQLELLDCNRPALER